MELSAAFLLGLYEGMVRIRAFEEVCLDLIAQNLFPGRHHSYVGQEAVAVGACAALEPGDKVMSTHRGSGHCLAMGLDPERLFAEFMGRATGFAKGKGGVMHVADPPHGLLATDGIVGSGASIAAGAAWALRLLGTDRVVCCFFGDGAANTGAFHEGMNLAAAWRLPVVFVCENNQYAISTKTEASVSIKDLAERAAAYGIPGTVVDGNDPVAVHHAVSEGVRRARAGGGPSLIEAKTYRLRGHYEGDPQTYREQAEVEAQASHDPVPRMRARLLAEGLADEASLALLEDRVREAIRGAAERARQAPKPRLDSLYEDVYA
jgi:TPP-dependent pyruvate/acetoin dehydrogenase alpha subunit